MTHKHLFTAIIHSALLVAGMQWIAERHVHADSPDDAHTNTDADAELRLESVTQRGITLTIRCADTLVSGAVNYVTITVRNDGEDEITFSPHTSPLLAGIRFKVMREGTHVDMTALGAIYLVQPTRHMRTPAIRIGKGEEIRVVVNLTRYYDLSLKGDYQIVATWIGPIAGEDLWIRLRTQPLDFKVIVKPGESVPLR